MRSANPLAAGRGGTSAVATTNRSAVLPMLGGRLAGSAARGSAGAGCADPRPSSDARVITGLALRGPRGARTVRVANGMPILTACLATTAGSRLNAALRSISEMPVFRAIRIACFSSSLNRRM